jgi:hypothetical protein
MEIDQYLAKSELLLFAILNILQIITIMMHNRKNSHDRHACNCLL